MKVNAHTGKRQRARSASIVRQRWAAGVMPQILMQLMRHEVISTTLKFYLGKEAEATADVLWAAAGKSAQKRYHAP